MPCPGYGRPGCVRRTPGTPLRECPPPFGLLLYFAAGSTRCPPHGTRCWGSYGFAFDQQELIGRIGPFGLSSACPELDKGSKPCAALRQAQRERTGWRSLNAVRYQTVLNQPLHRRAVDRPQRVRLALAGCSAQRNQGGGRRPGDIRFAAHSVGASPPRTVHNITLDRTRRHRTRRHENRCRRRFHFRRPAKSAYGSHHSTGRTPSRWHAPRTSPARSP